MPATPHLLREIKKLLSRWEKIKAAID